MIFGPSCAYRYTQCQKLIDQLIDSHYTYLCTQCEENFRHFFFLFSFIFLPASFTFVLFLRHPKGGARVCFSPGLIGSLNLPVDANSTNHRGIDPLYSDGVPRRSSARSADNLRKHNDLGQFAGTMVQPVESARKLID